MDDDDDWHPLSQQPEWQDIQPIYEVNDCGVVSIAYDPGHREAQAYFKAIQQKEEYSERVLALTAMLIDFNSANYTAWQYRWDCLVKLGKDLKEEYVYTQYISQDNAKNYQLWNCRRKCAFALGHEMATVELDFAAQALVSDAKNYHAWSHRQAVVQEYQLWEQELEFTQLKIEADVRNNSAWNQRMFVLQHYGPSKQPQFLAAELCFVVDQIRKAPRNESSWQYLRGLFQLHDQGNELFAQHPQVLGICLEVLELNASCAPALECLADLYELLALKAAATGQHAEAKKARSIEFQLVKHLIVADSFRTNYWAQRAQRITHLGHSSPS